MRVNEIFYSLQGEGAHSGEAAIFIRLSGCNLRCPFCDTIHEPCNILTEDEIISQIEEYPANWVVITGGEPTLQPLEALIGKDKLDLLVARGKQTKKFTAWELEILIKHYQEEIKKLQ